MSLIRYFDFQKEINYEVKGNDHAVILFDIFLICLIFFLVGSRFILAPGTSIDLPSSKEIMIEGSTSSEVLSIRENEKVIYKNRWLDISEFEKLLKKEPLSIDQRAILLIKGDSETSLKNLLRIIEIAKKGGFIKVHIAKQSLAPKNILP